MLQSLRSGHAELKKAANEVGQVGEAAQPVVATLHPHFVKEEEYILAPLGILSPLAQPMVTADMQAALRMTDRLQADSGDMLEEHRAIVARLERPTDPAGEERN
ncbi:MAG: hypothetical protein QUS33_06015 [Dehalococcoidia bacterium]|nr:hypothetical protein [Dehalococcoidia bacterium]